jgi:hypothetical protein
MEINDILEEIDSLEDEMNDEIATEEADEDWTDEVPSYKSRHWRRVGGPEPNLRKGLGGRTGTWGYSARDLEGTHAIDNNSTGASLVRARVYQRMDKVQKGGLERCNQQK